MPTDLRPRLIKKPSSPPIQPPQVKFSKEEKYHQRRLVRLGRFRRSLAKAYRRDPELAARYIDTVAFFQAEWDRGIRRSRQVGFWHRRWMETHPEYAALELFRLAWFQHSAMVPWP